VATSCGALHLSKANKGKTLQSFRLGYIIKKNYQFNNKFIVVQRRVGKILVIKKQKIVGNNILEKKIQQKKGFYICNSKQLPNSRPDLF